MAYSAEQWEKAKGLFEAGLSLQDIADRVDIKSRDTISKRAKKENWVKNKILQTKDRIIEVEKENYTISEKNSTMIEEISTLERYQIDVLKDLVEDVTKQKSVLMTGLNMAAIRATQKLQANKKTEMIKVKEGFGAGISKEYFEEVESELSTSDVKDCTETLIKAGQGMGLIEKDGTNITLNNQQNQMQQANINKDIVVETLESFEDEY